MLNSVLAAVVLELSAFKLGAVIGDQQLRITLVGKERTKQVNGSLRRSLPGRETRILWLSCVASPDGLCGVDSSTFSDRWWGIPACHRT